MGPGGTLADSAGWGTTSDVPRPGDYDRDGKTDFCVFRPSTSVWYIIYSNNNSTAGFGFGTTSDIPVPADFDGDGKTDPAVYRPSTGYWYWMTSSDNYSTTLYAQFGNSTDVPFPADYDGDGKADVAVWRNSDTTFYTRRSTDITLQTATFGTSGDTPVSADYDGDGKANYALRHNAGWVILNAAMSSTTTTTPSGDSSSDIPVPGDYDADGNPDNNSWTAGFIYDSNGNVLTTTDAKGTTITSTYDALNRPLTRTYSDSTPTVTNYYDGAGLPSVPNYSKGKLTRVSSSVSDSRYTGFDLTGRLLESQQITDGNTYTSSYQYNLSGALTQETYPSGRVVKNDLDVSGDLARIYGKATSTASERTYANDFTYTADSKIASLKLGNGLIESAKLNSRSQVTELTLGHSVGDGSLLKLNYDYGELNTDGSVDATKNAGKIAKQAVSFSGLTNAFIQTYKYDSLDRITEAIEKVNGTQTWKQTFGYDIYGNRNAFYQKVGATELTINSSILPSVIATTNRFSSGQGFAYDKNGNITTDVDPMTGHSRQFIFNGDNKQTQVNDTTTSQTKGTYSYDGNGKRVKKVTDTETTIFVYDGMGKSIAEYSNVTPPSNPTTNYTATDTLGSPRVLTNSTGDVVSRRDFMPFGEELFADSTNRTTARKYSTSDQDAVRQRFTGYQKDSETGLDFAEARYYNNQHGRFTAVDPLLASGKSANPQTFNRYVYGLNRPLILNDPTGLQAGSSGSTRGQAEFFVKYPEIANAIGIPDPKGLDTNISSVAARFAVNSSLTNRREGGEMNALRHVIWSAMITARFGAEIAKKATDAHEGVESVEIPSNGKMPEATADTVVDLANNDIGRGLGEQAAKTKMTPKDIAIAALGIFRTQGLFVTRINGNDTTISKVKISAADAAQTKVNWADRNAQTGLAPDQQKELETEKKKDDDEKHNRRLGRDRNEE